VAFREDAGSGHLREGEAGDPRAHGREGGREGAGKEEDRRRVGHLEGLPRDTHTETGPPSPSHPALRDYRNSQVPLPRHGVLRRRRALRLHC
jgi:hypothetical protein